MYLGVREYYQHQGIGQALINRIEAWALNHHIRRIEATVVTENINAIELFKGMDKSKVNLKISFYKPKIL